MPYGWEIEDVLEFLGTVEDAVAVEIDRRGVLHQRCSLIEVSDHEFGIVTAIGAGLHWIEPGRDCIEFVGPIDTAISLDPEPCRAADCGNGSGNRLDFGKRIQVCLVLNSHGGFGRSNCTCGLVRGEHRGRG